MSKKKTLEKMTGGVVRQKSRFSKIGQKKNFKFQNSFLNKICPPPELLRNFLRKTLSKNS